VVSSSAAQTYTTAVKIYASSIATPANSLDANLTLEIEEGTGGGFAAGCGSFTPTGPSTAAPPSLEVQ
jgi:hypothetical protein